MRLRDIMTTEVITISSNTTIGKADEILSKHKIRRLPVVDKGELVGVVSKDGIINSSLGYNVPVAPWKIGHFFYNRKVKGIMSKVLVTAPSDTTVTEAVFLAQKNKVGCLPVVDNDKLVGIVTTNDFFYKVLNPLLGVWQKGTQFIIQDPDSDGDISEVFQCFKKNKAKILAIRYIDLEHVSEKNLAVRVETTEEDQIEADLKSAGYNVYILHLKDSDE